MTPGPSSMLAGMSSMRGGLSPRQRGLGRLELRQLVLQVADLGARAGELARLGVAEPRHGCALALQTHARLRQLISLSHDFAGQGQQADLELPEVRGLRRDRTAGGTDLADDGDVLLSDPLHERQSVQQILEARRLDHHAHDVRRIGLVGGNELLREHSLGVRRGCLELAQTGASIGQLDAKLVELSVLRIDVGLDSAQPACQGGDARVELPDPTGGGAHRARQRRDASMAGRNPLLELADARRPRGRGARAKPDGSDAHGQRRQHDDTRGVGEWRPSNVHRELQRSRPRARPRRRVQHPGSGGGHANRRLDFPAARDARVQENMQGRNSGRRRRPRLRVISVSRPATAPRERASRSMSSARPPSLSSNRGHSLT